MQSGRGWTGAFPHIMAFGISSGSEEFPLLLMDTQMPCWLFAYRFLEAFAQSFQKEKKKKGTEVFGVLFHRKYDLGNPKQQ